MTDSWTGAGATEVLVVGIPREILGSLPGGTDLTPDDRLLDLGMTSFQLMQALIAVERPFAAELSDSALRLETFESAGSIAAVVDSLASEQPATRHPAATPGSTCQTSQSH